MFHSVHNVLTVLYHHLAIYQWKTLLSYHYHPFPNFGVFRQIRLKKTSNIFYDNLHSFSIPCNKSILSLIIIYSSKKTAFFKIRSGRLSVSRYKQLPRTNIAPVGSYYTKIGVYRKAKLGWLKAFSRSTKILNVTTLPFLIAGNFPVLKNYFSAVHHSFGKYQDKFTAN